MNLLPRPHRLLLILLAAAAGAIGGCGTATYEAKLEARLRLLTEGSDFVAQLVSEPVDLGQTPLTMQFPKGFTHRFDAEHRGDPDEPTRNIDPVEYKPPYLPDFPGFVEMWRGEAKDAEEATMRYFLFIGVVDAGDVKIDQLLAGLSNQVRTGGSSPSGGLENVPNDWEEVEARRPPPQGGTVKWRKLRATGSNLFNRQLLTGDHEFRKFPETLELWVHETPEHIVVLGYRRPDAIADKVDLFRAAELAAGTIKSG